MIKNLDFLRNEYVFPTKVGNQKASPNPSEGGTLKNGRTLKEYCQATLGSASRLNLYNPYELYNP